MRKRIIELNADRYVTPRKEQADGVEFWVSLSPYQVPDQLSCAYDKDSGCFAINFEYGDSEGGEEIKGDDLISLVVGKLTGKLLSVKIRVDHFGVNAIRLVIEQQVLEAIERVRGSHAKASENYQLAEQVLTDNASRIAECVAN